MRSNILGEVVLCDQDIFDYVMQGHDLDNLSHATVDDSVDTELLSHVMQGRGVMMTWARETRNVSQQEFDQNNQANWHMPTEYKELDIAAYLLSLCQNQEQLQRVAHELLLYQDRDLFDLLRYLKYLVDVMRKNQIIWGVGRGSCVASYCLYLLGVHRIDSMFYDLEPEEFLR